MHRITPDQAQPLHDSAGTRRLEQAAAALLPPHTLMQRAGLAVARLALALAPHARCIWLACGPGNNGGDGLEAAVHLQRWGLNPLVTWLGDEAHLPADAHASLQRARAAGVRFSDAPPPLGTDDLCIDALLGLGASRAPEGQLRDWITALNASPAPTLAVDVPSGLNGDTGQHLGDAPHATVQAQHTLTLLSCKSGLFTAQGRDAAGSVWFDDLGVDAAHEPPCAHINITPPHHPRPHASHKGSNGDVAILGGEGLAARGMGMSGAALLAASAALHGGAGRVLVCLLDGGSLTVDPVQPELMLRSLPALGRLDAAGLTVVCGCGGGMAVREPLARVLTEAPRLVLDADALNAIASDAALRAQLRARQTLGWVTVLTPHPLEAARLLQSSSAQVQANRLAAAQQLVTELGAVVVLKGSGSVVAGPGQTPVINLTGNAKLAAAGTGDVLAGLIGARLAQGDSPWAAACAAVYQHGARADEWPEGRTLTASALVRRLTAD